MKDLILDEGYDLEVGGGDLTVGESDEQTVALLMETVPGEWKCSVEDGVGMMRWAGAPGREMQGLKHHIQECLKRNGIKWKRIDIEEGNVVVELKDKN